MNDKATKQLLTRLSPVTHRQLRIHAAVQGTSMSTVVERAVSELILRETEDATPQRKAAA